MGLTDKLVNLDVNVSKLAAEIRAEYNLKTPDSIQLASSLTSKSDFFLTNDLHLKQDKIQNLVLKELIEKYT